MLHRQKTYDMYIQFYIDKRHMTCIYNLHRQKTYDMYIQFYILKKNLKEDNMCKHQKLK